MATSAPVKSGGATRASARPSPPLSAYADFAERVEVAARLERALEAERVRERAPRPRRRRVVFDDEHLRLLRRVDRVGVVVAVVLHRRRRRGAEVGERPTRRRRRIAVPRRHYRRIWAQRVRRRARRRDAQGIELRAQRGADAARRRVDAFLAAGREANAGHFLVDLHRELRARGGGAGYQDALARLGKTLPAHSLTFLSTDFRRC